MIRNKVCIPKQSRNRRNTLFWGLGVITFSGFLVILFSLYVIIEIIRGHNPFPTPEMIIGGFLFLILFPIAIISIVRNIRRTWIEVGETDLRISKGILWNAIPYEEITGVRILTNGDIEISYGDNPILLKREDLDDCYEVLLSRLQGRIRNG